MRRAALVSAAASILLSAGAASAAEPQADPTIDDFRCALAGVLASEESDKERQAFGAMLAIYFLGRMDGREPQFDGQMHLDKQFGDLLKLDANGLSQATRGCFQTFADSQARLEEWAKK